MSYSTYTSILPIVPGLPQTSSSEGMSTTVQVVQRHITRVDSIVDGYLSKRYAVPFSPTPPLVTSISEDLTVYYTYRSFYTSDNQNNIDYFDELKEDAVKMLDNISKGELNLVNTAGSVLAETSSDVTDVVDSNMREHQPFFDVDSIYNWDFDDDLKDDVDDARD